MEETGAVSQVPDPLTILCILPYCSLFPASLSTRQQQRNTSRLSSLIRIPSLVELQVNSCRMRGYSCLPFSLSVTVSKHTHEHHLTSECPSLSLASTRGIRAFDRQDDSNELISPSPSFHAHVHTRKHGHGIQQMHRRVKRARSHHMEHRSERQSPSPATSSPLPVPVCSTGSSTHLSRPPPHHRYHCPVRR